MAFSIEQTGNPLVKGGNQGIVDAYKALIEEHGGQLLTERDVCNIELHDGKARSVLCTNGDRFSASKGVIANVTPTALYQQLLPQSCLPREVIEQAAAYRYGRGMMMIHIAMDEPAQWQDPALQEVVMLHVTPGLDAVSKAVTEADCGLLPDKATIVVCQPVALDQSRAPDGKWILWIQLQEIPQTIKGDARNKIECPADGQWNKGIREEYADRVIEQLSRNILNLNSALLKRVVYSPKDLGDANINLLHGDAYSGVCSLDQFLFWRPLKALKNHQTPVSNVFHIGASTHPGPGLGGGSGYLLAKSLIG